MCRESIMDSWKIPKYALSPGSCPFAITFKHYSPSYKLLYPNLFFLIKGLVDYSYGYKKTQSADTNTKY